MVDDLEDQKGINIPKIEEKWPKKFWSMVEQAKKGSKTFALAPMEEIYVDLNQCKFDLDNICGYIRFVESQESIDEDLKEMP